MGWPQLMENFIYGSMFMMSILFLYVIFGFEIPVIIVLSLIYLKMESINE